jgi:hypothetical protein
MTRNSYASLFAPAIALVLLSGCSTSKATADAPSDKDSTPAIASVRLPPVRNITAPEGTALKIRTTSTISTRANRTGETMHGSLEEPLIVDGSVLAPKGADVTLLIADSDKGGRVKGRAKLALRITSLSAADGATRDVQTNTLWREAHGTKKKDAAKVGIGSGIGAAIGAIAGGGPGAAIGAGAGAGAGGAVVLATHGDPAVIPAESVLQFNLAAPLTVELKG